MSISRFTEELIEDIDDPSIRNAFKLLCTDEVRIIDEFLAMLKTDDEAFQEFYNDVIDCVVTVDAFETIIDFSRLVNDFNVDNFDWDVNAGDENAIDAFKRIVRVLLTFDNAQLEVFYRFKRFCDKFIDNM